MQLILHRDQRTGMMGMGSQVFQLSVRADISPEEKEAIRKYKLGKTILYTNRETEFHGIGFGKLAAFAGNVALKMLTLTITVDDLTNGKVIECKDIVEMLSVEEQVRNAAGVFGNVLRAAFNFGGDEIVEF